MPPTHLTPSETTDSLINLLQNRGTADYIGEPITQLEHSLQCAYLSLQAGAADEVIIAALLHDIGQFLPVEKAKDVKMQMGIGSSSVGRVGHECIGEEYLRGLGFGEVVCRLVGSHVRAKRLVGWFTFPSKVVLGELFVSELVSGLLLKRVRYLTAVDPKYYDGLSEASKESLRFQGGPFEGVELERFENDELKGEMVRLRKWDDQAKIVGIEGETPRAERYKEMIVRHLKTCR